MALPTTNLTGHFDAKDTDKVFKVLNGGGSGVHTGVPADGDSVNAWDDEGDGIADICMSASGTPEFRSSSPLMIHPCLDFNASQTDWLHIDTQAGGFLAGSALISTTAFTIAIAFYPETVTTSQANAYENHALFGDAGPSWGLHLKDDTGTYKVLGYNNDGSVDVVSVNGGDPSRTWIAVYRHGSGNLNLTVIDDAGNESSASPVASGATTSLANQIRVGLSSAGTTKYDGRIGEVALYNAELTGTDLTNLKDYFKAQWLSLGGGGGVGGVNSGLIDGGLVNSGLTS